MPELRAGRVGLLTIRSAIRSGHEVVIATRCIQMAVTYVGLNIDVAHVHVGEGEVHIAFKSLVLAVVVDVNSFGDNLAGEGDDEGISDDRDPTQNLHDMEPDANAANPLSNWPSVEMQDLLGIQPNLQEVVQEGKESCGRVYR